MAAVVAVVKKPVSPPQATLCLLLLSLHSYLFFKTGEGGEGGISPCDVSLSLSSKFSPVFLEFARTHFSGKRGKK